MIRILRPLVILAVMGQLLGQEASPEPPSEPVIRTTTRAVVLDITVVDGQGNPVPGLTQQDFNITEDEVVQRIASFESAAPPVSAEAVDANSMSKLESASPSQTVIIFDELNTQFTDLAYARYSLEKLFKRNGSKLTSPTQLLALTDRGLKLVHDYTLDGSQLLTAVDTLPKRLPFKLSVNGEDEDRANMSLGALEQTALSNVKSGKRTVIVWLSPGYPVGDKGSLWNPKDRARFERAVQNLAIELLDSRVTIYSIDPRGVIANADDARNDRLNGLGSSGPFRFGDMALGSLAKETGGHAFYGRNDVDTQVATSLSQSSAFYTLSYYPSNGNYDGKFRHIHVQIKEPKLNAQTRNGYYAFPESAAYSVDQISLSLKRAMFTPLAYKAIPFSVQEISGDRGKKHLDLRVDGNALQWETQPNGEYRFHVMVSVGHYTPAQALDVHQFDLHGHVSASDAKDLSAKAVHIEVDEPDNSTASELRVAVCDFKSGLVGTATMTR